ncbi:hypothetical protein ACTXT7_004626 [Hymenolepis weldensis]
MWVGDNARDSRRIPYHDRMTPNPASNDRSPAKTPKGLPQPARQFTYMIMGRMAHEQKVSSELDEVACYMRWMLMAKLGRVIEITSVAGAQKNHRNWKRVP